MAVTRSANETKLPQTSQRGVHSPTGENSLHPPAEQRALDAWQARIDANRLDVLLQKGELLLFNNRRIMHARSAFTDDKRLLYRLWIAADAAESEADACGTVVTFAIMHASGLSETCLASCQ